MKCFYCGHEIREGVQEVDYKSFKGLEKGVAHKDLTMCISNLSYEARILREELKEYK